MQKPTTAEAIFSGTFERSLDSKNRVTVPAGWAVSQEETYHVIPNGNPQEPFLIVMPETEFAKTEQKIEATDQKPADKRKAIRAFYSVARAVTVDKQGRMLVPEEYCKKAGLNAEVVLVGTKSRFEVWSKDRWNATTDESQETYEKFADLIGL